MIHSTGHRILRFLTSTKCGQQAFHGYLRHRVVAFSVVIACASVHGEGPQEALVSSEERDAINGNIEKMSETTHEA